MCLNNARRMLQETRANIKKIEISIEDIDTEGDEYVIGGNFDYILTSTVNSARAHIEAMKLQEHFLYNYISANENKFPIYK